MQAKLQPFTKTIYSDLIFFHFKAEFRFFLFWILPLRFLFYSIFNISACRFPLFCWLRKIRSVITSSF